MSEFLKYLRSILGLGTYEEKSLQRNRKRRVAQEEFENYSQKLRRLNDYKIKQYHHHNNDDWSEITPSLKPNYQRRFPNRSQAIHDKRPAPNRRTVYDTIDLSDDDDVTEVTSSKFYSSSLNHGNETFKSNGLLSSHSSGSQSNIVLLARQNINKCIRFLNRSKSTSSIDALRPEEHEIYRDMVLNSPRTSAAYMNSSSLNSSTSRCYEQNNRTKKILSLLKEKTAAPVIDSTGESRESN